MQKYIFFVSQPSFNVLLTAYILSSFKIENNIDCNNDNSKLNSKAIQKPLTAKPSKISPAKRMINALMTNKNKPRVTIVIGNVRSMRIGFKMTFKSAKTMATIMAPVNPATSTPGRNFAKITTAMAVSKILIIKFIRIMSATNTRILFYVFRD